MMVTDVIKAKCEEMAPGQSAREGMTIPKSQIRIEDTQQLGEQMCVICCGRRADAVILPCSHGALCFECASTIAQQRAVCHFCRKVTRLSIS